jgi:nitroreductase
MKEPGLFEIMKRRYSCRSYTGTPISVSDKKRVAELMSQSEIGPFGNESAFKLIGSEPGDSEALKGLGTYGFIKKPAGFIIGSINKSPMNLEDFGYCMEKAILFITKMGLGTCWIGGTFKKSRFAEKACIGEGMEMPAVSAIGYIANRKTIRERLTRANAGSDKRKNVHELFFSQELKELDSDFYSSPFGTVLKMVRIAPSASNKQPWRIICSRSGNDFHFFLERTKGYDLTIKRYDLSDLQRIDMGIAMCHFDLAAKEFGFKGSLIRKKPQDINYPGSWEYVASWNKSDV